MRALLVVCSAAALSLLVAPSAQPAAGMSVRPEIGDRITQTAVFQYLFAAPGTGDWLRYRFSHNGRPVLTKNVGFGSDRIGAASEAYFETTTQLQPLTDSPVHSFPVAGGTVVTKLYVNAADFSDPARRFSVVGGAVRIGDATFTLDPKTRDAASALDVPLQTLLLSGALPLPDERLGTVVGAAAEDVNVQGHPVHCVHLTADFPPSRISGATDVPALRLEAWQSPDVPLGTVAWKTSVGSDVFDVRLVAFGRASYRATISSDQRGNANAGYQR
ncbi:MAG: hypothetical protein DLM53_04580 [Candidatus Eremiobacter antarcticus]|nr:hypothetical protein [Candidatus Eremiobacteraeota bacterium]MBC5807943.1 hypothetical protein [Candidatus Eremiobacteraeota bacterium]PZR62691.1 MAG: hypothetical protein DLM53_04580 [Candidatus Eremiobacter sp. RRmetagenome_bin22]